MKSLCCISLLLLIGEILANDYESRNSHQSIVTSAPLHVGETHSSRNQQYGQQKPAVLTQSYKVLPESRNYYQYPQYLPTQNGYSNIQGVGQPYQMYSSASGSNYASNVVSGGSGGSENYGSSVPAHITTLAPAPYSVSDRHRAYSFAPTPPSPYSEQHDRGTQHARAPAYQSPARQLHRSPAPPPSSILIDPKPILSYGASNPFLANLPPAQGVYGAPVDSSNTAYDGLSGAEPASPPGSSASLDDTWEALESSLDASNRKRHRKF